MVKKLFALASVSALAGLVSAVGAAGCSETVVQQGPADAGPKEASTKPPPVDAGEEEPEPVSCAGKDPIDATQYPYASALKSAGACTTDDLTNLSAYFKTKLDADEDVLVSQWSKEVSDTCSACVFGGTDAAEWAPLLVKDDKLDGVNRGGCVEVVSGKPACGKAYQQVTECRLNACLPTSQGGVGTCKTQEEFEACLDDAEGIFTGPCKDSFDALIKECGNNLGAYEDACKGVAYTFEGPIKVQCITGGAKTDVDAGDDAGDGG